MRAEQCVSRLPRANCQGAEEMSLPDFRPQAPPFVLVGSDRCQLQVIGAGETQPC